VPSADRQDSSGPRRWVFTMTAAFLFAAAVLRSLLEFEGDQLLLVLALLAAWAVLLVVEPPLSRRWPPSFALYLVLQAVVVGILLGQSDGSDYFAILLAVPSMRALERWQPRWALALIAAFAVLTGLGVVDEFGPAAAVALTAVYTSANLILASYAWTARRATDARVRNEALAADLREANQRLVDSARQAELLAAARERQRLARDLHDSVTQTLFGLTLAARSAALLLERQPKELAAQLDQVERLATSAQAELGALSAELPSSPLAGGGLVAGLRRHAEERATLDGLSVTVRVDGERRLPPDVELALLRIVQEALNNVVKHAGVTEAEVRLRLRRPAAVEIQDRGSGFGSQEGGGRGVGLGIMRERAAEIGWRLTVTSAAGEGTRVVAEETSEAAGPIEEARQPALGQAEEGGDGGG